MSTRYERHPKMNKYLEAFKSEDGKSPIFRTLWDIFYLSFMVGLAADKKTPEKEWQDKQEIVDDMANYGDKRILLMATLLIKKLNKRGREVKTTQDLQKELSDLIDANSMTFNDEGFTLFNEYAYWGFEEIERRIAKNPSNPGQVFSQIYDFISNKLG